MNEYRLSELIYDSTSAFVPTYPVVIDALEGNDMPEEYLWYKLTFGEQLTKDEVDHSAELQMALVCNASDRVQLLAEKIKVKLRADLRNQGVSCMAMNSYIEYINEDEKFISYISTTVNY